MSALGVQRILRSARLASGALVVVAGLAVACGSDDDAAGEITATSPPSTTTTVIATTTAAGNAADESEVRAAFVGFFDGSSRDVDAKVRLLENGEDYRQMLVDADADPQAQQLRAEVRDVGFVADAECSSLGVVAPCAVVTFDLLVSGMPALVAHEDAAVRVDGTWKVAAKTWCDVVAIGGETCPA